MHFRERGKIIQVIRTTYDAASKKGKPDIVARLDKNAPAITDEIRKGCSPEEIKEIETWIAEGGKPAVARSKGERGGKAGKTGKTRRAARAERADKSGAPKAEFTSEALTRQLGLAIKWFRGQEPNAENAAVATQLGQELAKLRKTLKKKGFLPEKAGAKAGRKAKQDEQVNAA